jgi:ketosteroid isomerase-like protein
MRRLKHIALPEVFVARHPVRISDATLSVAFILVLSGLAVPLSPRFTWAQAQTRAVTLSPPARANGDSQSERELRAILDELSAAVLHHDANAVQQYYSPDYVMTFSDGKRGGFDNSLHVLTDTTRNEWRLHDLSNEHFMFYGPTAIVTFTVHSQWTVRASHRDFDVREHVTQTWLRRDDRWTLLATHVTSIDPSQP